MPAGMQDAKVIKKVIKKAGVVTGTGYSACFFSVGKKNYFSSIEERIVDR